MYCNVLHFTTTDKYHLSSFCQCVHHFLVPCDRLQCAPDAILRHRIWVLLPSSASLTILCKAVETACASYAHTCSVGHVLQVHRGHLGFDAATGCKIAVSMMHRCHNVHTQISAHNSVPTTWRHPAQGLVAVSPCHPLVISPFP